MAWALAGQVSDLAVQKKYALLILHGWVPFRDFVPEYPPLVFAFTLLPALLPEPQQHYEAHFRILCFLLDCGVFWLLVRNVCVGLCGLYVLASAACGTFWYDRTDVVLALILTAGLISLLKGKRHTFYLLLGLGIAFRIIPIVLGPVVLAAEFRRGLIRTAVCAASLFLPMVLSVTFIIALGGTHFREMVAFHLHREVQIESGPASVELLLMYAHVPAQVLIDRGAVNLRSANGQLITMIASVVLALIILGASGAALRRRFSPEVLACLLTAVICASLVLSKVLSPQYLIFLLPMLLTIPQPASRALRRTVWLVTLLIYTLTGRIMTYSTYTSLVHLNSGAIGLLLCRNGALSLLGAELFHRTYKLQNGSTP